MNNEEEKIIIKDKIIIKAEIELLTGMHIGTNDGIATIGAVDSVVIRDPITNRTMIPGSSLKGKMRRLLLNEEGTYKIENSRKLERIFGTSSNKGEKRLGRLQFSDAFLTDESEKELSEKQLDLQYTEIKFENHIDGITLIANPRQIERAVKGSKYGISLNYTLQKIDEIEEDFETIAKGFKLLQLDYIGGNGTRGYGRVKFNNIEILPMKLKGEDLIADKMYVLDKIMKEVMN